MANSTYCQTSNQAKVSYTFGGKTDRLYLCRKCPFEIRISRGPVGFPGEWGGQIPYWEVRTTAPWADSTGISGGFSGFGPVRLPTSQSSCAFSFTAVSFDDDGDILRVYPSSWTYDFGTSVCELIPAGSSPAPTKNEPPEAVFKIEVIHEGKVIYSDSGTGECRYSVKCGNGCDEDRELTVTEVANYPGTWCLTEDELRRLGRAGDELRRLNQGMTAAAKKIDNLNRELDKTNNANITPEAAAFDEALDEFLDELESKYAGIKKLPKESDSPSEASDLDRRIAELNELRNKLLKEVQDGGPRVPEFMGQIRDALNNILTLGDGTPGDGTPGDGTPGDGTPGDGTPGGGTPGTIGG